MRVKFEKGMQRKFMENVLHSIGCPSLRGLRGFGFDVSYSTLKNYFSEERTLPKDLFDDLCHIAKIDSGGLKVVFLEDNWGKVKGGRR